MRALCDACAHLATRRRMLNRIWLGFFVTAALAALARWLAGGDAGVFAAMIASLFDMAKLSVEVMILLFGTLTLWLGLLRIAERAGLVEALACLLGPLFRRIMPEVPAGHPAIQYRDVFPRPPAPGTVPSCAQAGVLGAVCGAVGSAMAIEALKLIVGIGDPLLGRLAVFDALAGTWRHVPLRPSPATPFALPALRR